MYLLLVRRPVTARMVVDQVTNNDEMLNPVLKHGVKQGTGIYGL